MSKRRITPRVQKGRRIPVRRIVYIAVNVVALLIAAVLVLRNYVGNPDVRDVKKLVYAGRDAVESRDVSACLAVIDESYTDNQNNTYDAIVERSREGFGDVSDISIRLRALTVEMAPDKTQATARFVMRFRAKVQDPTGRRIPVAGILGSHSPLGPSWESVMVECVKKQGRWLISRLDVQPVRN